MLRYIEQTLQGNSTGRLPSPGSSENVTLSFGLLPYISEGEAWLSPCPEALFCFLRLINSAPIIAARSITPRATPIPMPAFAPVDSPDADSGLGVLVSEVNAVDVVPLKDVGDDVDASGNNQPLIWIAKAIDTLSTVEVAVYQLDCEFRVAYLTTWSSSSSETHCPVFPTPNTETKL